MTSTKEQLNSESLKKSNEMLMRSATYAAVFVALSLIGVKLWAYLETDSVSILSTLVDSLLDLGASLVNLFAVRHALVPADEDHRFGHGKAEALAGLFQSAFIGGSAIFLLLQAAERLVN
ncbi:MAG: cation transporter, partial [Sneathiella sp.]|nr:cation transporter [Sneathiella sp.]